MGWWPLGSMVGGFWGNIKFLGLCGGYTDVFSL